MIASLFHRALVGLALLLAGATASHGQEDGPPEDAQEDQNGAQWPKMGASKGPNATPRVLEKV